MDLLLVKKQKYDRMIQVRLTLKMKYMKTLEPTSKRTSHIPFWWRGTLTQKSKEPYFFVGLIFVELRV